MGPGWSLNSQDFLMAIFDEMLKLAIILKSLGRKKFKIRLEIFSNFN